MFRAFCLVMAFRKLSYRDTLKSVSLLVAINNGHKFLYLVLLVLEDVGTHASALFYFYAEENL